MAQRPTQACSNARFDCYSITFMIDVESAQIPCAISLAAFDAISGDKRRQRAQLLSSFQTHDARISRIARGLFRRRPESIDGTIRIWENDVDDDEDNIRL